MHLSILLRGKQVLLLILLCCLAIVTTVQGQDVATLAAELQRSQADTARVQLLNKLARAEVSTGSLPKASLHATQALDLSVKTGYKHGRAVSMLTLGYIHRAKKDFTGALTEYLQALMLLETLHAPELAGAYRETALLYQDWRVYDKAAAYFLRYAELNKHNPEEQLYAFQHAARSYAQIKDYNNAIKYYTQVVELCRKQNDRKALLNVYEHLSTLSKLNGQYSEAIRFDEQITTLDIAEPLQKAQAYNNIGVSYKRLKDNTKALEYFNKALQLNKSLLAANRATKNEEAQAAILTNIGVIHLYLGDYYVNSLNSFYEALKIREKQKNTVEIARVYNYIATDHYIGGDNEQALEYVQKAAALAQKVNAQDVLQESYRILSEIHQRNEDFRESQRFYKMHLALKDSLAATEAREQQALLQNQIAVEKKENELKTMLADRERQENLFKQLALEAQKKEQDLALKAQEVAMLKQEQELQETNFRNQQLEKERVQQALLLAEQQLQAQKRNQRLLTLEQQKTKQDLELKEKKLKEIEQQKKLGTMEAQQKLQRARLQEEKVMRQVGYGLMGLFGIILCLIGYSYYQKQKANRILAQKNTEVQQQKEEIEATAEQLKLTYDQLQTKNDLLIVSEEELRQSMEELEASHEQIESQKTLVENTLRELEESSLRVNDSIRYAMRIQQAILPDETHLNEFFPEHFVVFRPKDVVSGDFYWFWQAGNRAFIAAVDCTGHGVPGAFMSMIGNTMLNEIVHAKQISDPGEVLDELHSGIYVSLKQKQTKNADGMDICFCCVERNADGTTMLRYSGAKRPLYYASNGQVQQVAPTRKSIGGWEKEPGRQYFVTHTLLLKKGDSFYMTTDGLIDAANAEKERFGSMRFMEMLGSVASLPLAAQRTQIDDRLDTYQQGAAQRDDILLLGFRV